MKKKDKGKLGFNTSIIHSGDNLITVHVVDLDIDKNIFMIPVSPVSKATPSCGFNNAELEGIYEIILFLTIFFSVRIQSSGMPPCEQMYNN